MKKVFLCMVLAFLAVVSVNAVEFPDMPLDSSRQALESAVENGLIYGDGGYILPENNITRGEMAAVMVRAFGATQKADLSDFTDVPANEWYYDSLACAVQMGIFYGHDGKLTPDDFILREEAFAVVARALFLNDADVSELDKFTDAGDVSDWAKGSVAALAKAGYVNGDNGRVEPLKYITRAEFAQLMYNIFKTYIKTPGEYSDTIEGNVIITANGVTLKDCDVKGDIIIGDGVVVGVKLQNVNAEGRIVVRGGNNNSFAGVENNRIVMNLSGTAVKHDVYGLMLGEENFSVLPYISSAYPGGFVYENDKVTVPQGTIVTIGEYEIPFSVFRYYYLSARAMFDSGNISAWENTKIHDENTYNAAHQQLNAYTINSIIKDIIITQDAVKKYKIELTEEEKAEMEAGFLSTKEEYAKYGLDFEQQLYASKMDYNFYVMYVELNKKITKLHKQLFYDQDGKINITDDKVDKYIEDNKYMRAQHILVEDAETADEVLKKLEEGQDFMALVEEYGKDPGMTQAGEAGYTFKEGEMVPEFENACLELEIGEISGPVQTSYGYHIIRRLEIQEDYRETIAQQISTQEFSAIISAFAENYDQEKVVYSELYNLIKPENLY
ncbi:MAG: S-layer homology domain-containing protein [Clostridia bacterium]|nr:S-layer homology domain-containing protein [Clostridia bacterium]